MNRISSATSYGCGAVLFFLCWLIFFTSVIAPGKSSISIAVWRGQSLRYMGEYTSISTGGIFASTTTAELHFSWDSKDIVSPQQNRFEKFTNSAILCNSTFLSNKVYENSLSKLCNSNYECIGQYGWCPNGKNTIAKTPKAVNEVHGLMISVSFFLFSSSLVSCLAGSKAFGGPLTVGIAFFLCLIASILLCTAGSLAASNEWYATFSENANQTGFLPYVANNGSIFIAGPFSGDAALYNGMAYYITWLSFTFTLLALLAFGLSFKNALIYDDVDVDYVVGDYGTGGSGISFK